MHTNKRIFVVDDDAGICTLLKKYLEQQSLSVITAGDGESFLKQLRGGEQVDLVVLDIMLPGADGFDVCRELRGFSNVPVIMLTANSDETDRIVGLELGADDYLAKPFNPRELLARIKAIFRRMEGGAETGSAVVEDAGRYFLFSGFQLDTVSRKLLNPDSQEVSLSGADYQLLLLLVENSGEILGREKIAEITRGRDNQPMDRFIDVQMSRLRSRLGDDARAPLLIKTVRGKGYVLTSEVKVTDEPVFSVG